MVGTWSLLIQIFSGAIALDSSICILTFLKLGCSLQSSHWYFLSLIPESILVNLWCLGIK